MKKHRALPLTIFELVLFGLFCSLSLFAAFSPFFRFDMAITGLIQNIQLPYFSSLMWLISGVGNVPYFEIIVVMGFTALYLHGHKRDAFFSTVLLVCTFTAGSIIKLLVDRPRPDPDYVNVLVRLADRSFPSNHTLIFTVYFGFLLYLSYYVIHHTKLKKTIQIGALILISTIGISRIYLGAHWASDVLGGYLLGLLILITSIQLHRRLS